MVFLKGSILVLLLFIFFINDLNLAIIDSRVFHCAEDKCLFDVQYSVVEISRFFNKDFKLLLRWLNFNGIYLNDTQAEDK